MKDLEAEVRRLSSLIDRMEHDIWVQATTTELTMQVIANLVMTITDHLGPEFREQFMGHAEACFHELEHESTEGLKVAETFADALWRARRIDLGSGE